MITSHDPLILEQQVIRSISVITKHGNNTILKEDGRGNSVFGFALFQMNLCKKENEIKSDQF